MTIKDYIKKYSTILFIFTIACIALATVSHAGYSNAAVNDNNDTGNGKNYGSTIIAATTAATTNNLFTNILAKNLEVHLEKAGAILEITSKLPQVRNVPYAHLLNQTLNTMNGIPQYADTEKYRWPRTSWPVIVTCFMFSLSCQTGTHIYLSLYSTQQNLTANNFAFRDYFQGAVKTNDVYLGNVINTKT